MALNSPTIKQIHGVVYAEASETVSTPTASGNTTTIFDARGFKEKTLYFKNTSDRTVDIQVQGSHSLTFTDVNDLGSALTLGAGNVTATLNFAVLTDYHPYIRVKVTAQSSNSTTGSVVVEARAQSTR